jgi:hypothetical protein
VKSLALSFSPGGRYLYEIENSGGTKLRFWQLNEDGSLVDKGLIRTPKVDFYNNLNFAIASSNKYFYAIFGAELDSKLDEDAQFSWFNVVS